MPPFENDDVVLTGLYGLSISDDDHQADSIAVPLTGVDVKAKVQDFVVEIQLSQCYHNTTDKNLECIYHLPINEGAAVCGFEAAYQNGDVVKGIVKEKVAAKANYEIAKRAGKQANLLESVRRDVFTLSVGNLPPDMYVKITITYVATLEARDDAAALVLPTCIAPRYIPSSDPVSWSDAQALAPLESNVKLFGLDIAVDVTCRSTIKTITCPTHAAALSVSTSHQTGRFSLKDIVMDRDVVVLIEEEKCHQPRASIEISPDGSMTGFVTLFPQIEFPDQDREFVFVVDRSGSMMDEQKIEQARDTLLLFLRSLPSSCTFNIVGFGSHYKPLFADGPKRYNDETLQAASQYAASMQADFGGTEILEPLRYIFGQSPAAGVERQVFVLTDGEVSNAQQVFNLIGQHCTAKARVCRLFSVGVGRNVSRLLVSGMARAGRGTSRFVEDGAMDALRVKVLGQLKQSMQPSLDNVSIEWTFPEEDQKLAPVSKIKTLLGYRSPSVDDKALSKNDKQPKSYPAITPPIFNKEKFLVYGMFASGGIKPDGVIVKCETIDGPLEVRLPISADEIFDGAIAKKLAARTAISEYEDSCHDRLTWSAGVITESEALQLALDNCLVSAKTSFIAILEKPMVDPNTPRESQTVPQANASGQAAVYTSSARMMMSRSMMPTSRPYGSLQCMPAPAFDAPLACLSHSFEFCNAVRADLGTAMSVPQFKAQARLGHFTTSQDRVVQLCLLQKADGSFVLSDDLIDAIGLPKAHVLEMMAQLGLPDKVIFATAWAVAVLRVQFATKHGVWELQEQKALVFLHDNEGGGAWTVTELLAQVETRVRAALIVVGHDDETTSISTDFDF